MKKNVLVIRITVILLFLIAIAGCGKAYIRTLQAPADLSGYKSIYMAPAKVSSKEQTPKALRLNAQWVAMAREEVTKGLEENGKYVISNSSAPSRESLILDTTINLVYGSRALRYWVGFGAGKGSCKVRLTLKDSSSGEVKYEVESESDLAIGAFGGSMDKLIQKNIRGAVTQFVSGL